MTNALKTQLAKVEQALKGRSEEELARERWVKTESFLRSLGQIPTNRVRQESMKLTKEIGLPEHTRMHELRNLFATSMQEADTDIFARQNVLGHSSLDMTGHYTMTRAETVRKEMQRSLENKKEVMKVVNKRLDGKAG